MWEVLCNARAMGYKAGTLEAIEQFVQMIKSFASMLNTKNAYEVATHVGKQTNIVKELFNDKTTEGLARYENIQELLNSIKEWVDTQQNLALIDEDGILIDNAETQETQKGQAGLSGYLQQITLLTDADQKDPDADTVKTDDDSCCQRTRIQLCIRGGTGRIPFSQCHVHQYQGRTRRRKAAFLCGHHQGKT